MERDTHEETGLHFLDYWRVVRARKEIILAVALLIILTGTGVTMMMPRIYMAEARISVRQDTLDIDVFSRQGGTAYNPFFLRTQYEIIQSRPILYDVIRNLNLREEWGVQVNPDGSPLHLHQAYGILRNSLRVQQYRDTNLIAIQCRREDPPEAARIANEVASVYRDLRLSQKRREIEQAVAALQGELEKQEDRVQEAEAELERLRSEMGITLLGRGVRADQVQLQRLEADRIGARVDMIVRGARLEQIEGLEGEELITASTYIVNDPVIAGLRRQMMDTKVSLELLLQDFGEQHPDVQRTQAAFKELEKQMWEALEGLKKGLRADYQVAVEKYRAIEAELESARELDIEAERERVLPFARAERTLAGQRVIRDALRARVVQEGIELEVPRTPVEIVDPAEPLRRLVSPNMRMNVMLSVILGLVAGVGLAFFIEYMDTSVKTIDDVERYLDLPVIGVVPQQVRLLTDEAADGAHAESYRVLRTNMHFANQGKQGGTFAVISANAGEGKSTTLFNLAYVTAEAGDKVLIVDSDLRRPVQHKMLGMQNRLGLTNVLMRDAPLEEMIKASSIPNLHFLASGRLPRMAASLLDSQKMRELVKNLRARYDYVFFDSPPIMGVSDASILSSEVDGCLLVVQYRKYPRVIAARAKRIVENVGGRIIGVVLNNINIKRDDYYYYHPYYDYASHAGAAEQDEPEKSPAPVPAGDDF